MPEQVAPPHAPRCRACGGAVAATASGLRCASCGAPTVVEDSAAVPRHDLFEALRAAQRGHFRDVDPEARSVACHGCGAITVTTHHAVRCAFCGGAVVLTELRDGLLPDAVAPFAIDEAFAKAQVERWLRRRWFAPSDLHRAAERDRLQSVYLPYWSFSVIGRAVYVGERGDVSYVVERRVGPYGRVTEHRVRQVRWRRGNGHVRGELRDHLVPATTSLPTALLAGLGPWRSNELRPFAAVHLHGHLAERYSVDLRAGFAVAERHLEEQLHARARRDLGGQEQRVHHLSAKYEDATFRQVLLPVWVTAVRYRQRVYRVVVHGQTGRLRGSRPYSTRKLVAVALLALAAVALGCWLARSPAPPEAPPEPVPELALR